MIWAIRKGCWALSIAFATATAAMGQQHISRGPHDLSTRGPGPIRAVDEDQICIFCHAPHNTEPAIPLWNRHNPQRHYRIYDSSTTDARIDQPGISDKMCLSCHDGSIAIGLVRSRPAGDPIVMNQDTMPPGPGNLTEDLSDDHPIGFRYDRALSNTDDQLRDPQTISTKLELGPHKEVKCATCHDPHDNELGQFLRVTDRGGALCTSCHQMYGWQTSSHARATRAVRGRIDIGSAPLRYLTMADNACLNCHQIHGAPSRERLLRHRTLEQSCLVCHDGSIATSVAGSINQRFSHKSASLTGAHDPSEVGRRFRDHVECVDCHNPHAVRPNSGRQRIGDDILTPGPMQSTAGVAVSGRVVPESRFYYQVCLRCHGDNPVRIRNSVLRETYTDNLRRQISPSAASSHPIAIRNRNIGEVPSVLPQYRGRRISCQDCHNDDNATDEGGSGPNGPHGSTREFMLTDNYSQDDLTIESAQAYALCYRCHDRNSILANESFAKHSRHIVELRSPCTACHDPHGVAGRRMEHSHLIDFNRQIVTPTARSADGLNYTDLGRFRGSCTLRCHGANHVRFPYRP